MAKLYRSRNGQLLGVCDGIARWRDLPVDTVRMIFVIITILTGIAPCLIAYLVLALILPVRPDRQYDGGTYERAGNKTYYYHPEPDDFVNGNTTYRGSEEDERRRKEDDWDNRFSKG